MNKDYYAILGVTPSASPEEIRRAYRKKAFEVHPDRNAGSHKSEEAFKELTEAYAVLGDLDRRRTYDTSMRSGTGRAAGFDPEELFSDLFRSGAFGGLFSDFSREFHRRGLRFDEAYLRRVFSGHRGGMIFGGFVFFGPMAGIFSPRLRGNGRPRFTPASAGAKVSPSNRTGLLGRLLRLARPGPRAAAGAGGDTHFTLPLSEEMLSRGGEVRVSVPGPSGTESYLVRIPRGSRPGTRLKLRGKGAGTAGLRGDLYLKIRLC